MTMVDIIMDLFRKDSEPAADILAVMDGMAERNAARIQKIKEEMGNKWILHPSHKKTRLDEPRPV